MGSFTALRTRNIEAALNRMLKNWWGKERKKGIKRMIKQRQLSCNSKNGVNIVRLI